MDENQLIYPKENMITLNTTDTKMHKILDAWLKYGTVFVVYRLCDHYFLKDNSDQLFDLQSLKLVLFILLGFTIYYLLVDPYVPINFKHPIINNLASDTLMFGTVLLSSHLMETFADSGDYFNKEWLKSAGIILLAFATYRIIVNPFVPFDKIKPPTRSIVSDWLQFGTALVAIRLLQGKSLMNKTWIASVLFILLGFTGYHLITKKLVVTKKDTKN